jgi:hypothetical protein
MQAKPSDAIVYFTGFIAHHDDDKPIQALKHQVQRAYDSGDILIAQRRVGPSCFSYIAIKAARAKPHKFFAIGEPEYA